MPVGVGAGSQPLILAGEPSGLLTRIATMASASLCEPMKANEGEGASFSVFKDKAGADEPVHLAADYVREHLSKLRTRKPEIIEGPIKAHNYADEKLTAFVELESAICLVAY